MNRCAEVVSVSGNIVEVKVERSSMCDGCSAKGSSCACSHAALLGADRSLTAKALCDFDVSVGDTVEIETVDSKVLLYAMLVFIFPIIVCAILFAVASRFFDGNLIPILVSFIGFILSFVVIGFIERRMRERRPDIIVVEVVSHKNEK